MARDGRVLREDSSDAARGHAERLPGDLASLLEHAGVALREVDVFAVATGPGSFTGLRIGIATMQGLAMATGKPLIGISALDALAAVADRKGPRRNPADPSDAARALTARVATWLDAWRGEVYAALYDNGVATAEPVVSRPEPLLEAIASPTLFIGDVASTFRDLITRALGDLARFADPITPPLAGTIAELATQLARRGDAPPPHAIRPLYVRRTDAELAADRGPRRIDA